MEQPCRDILTTSGSTNASSVMDEARVLMRLSLAPNEKPLNPSKSQTLSGSAPPRCEVTLDKTDSSWVETTLLLRTAIHRFGIAVALSRGCRTGAASANGKARRYVNKYMMLDRERRENTERELGHPLSRELGQLIKTICQPQDHGRSQA